MTLYERLAGLDLVVQDYELERLEREVSGGFTRVTTVVRLHGHGQVGHGEDVTWDAPDHDAVPADLGLGWAKKKPVNDAAALGALLGLARAGVPHVREEGAAYLAELLGKATFATPEHVRDLLDARFPEPRATAFAAIENDARFRESTVLWAALAESPYDDARALLVKHLAAREATFGPQTLRHVGVAPVRRSKGRRPPFSATRLSRGSRWPNDAP